MFLRFSEARYTYIWYTGGSAKNISRQPLRAAVRSNIWRKAKWPQKKLISFMPTTDQLQMLSAEHNERVLRTRAGVVLFWDILPWEGQETERWILARVRGKNVGTQDWTEWMWNLSFISSTWSVWKKGNFIYYKIC